jgi:hypothetical protein
MACTQICADLRIAGMILPGRNGKENGMIELIKRHLVLTLEKKLSFLADFSNTYVTSGYMIHVRQFVESTRNIIDKGALLGIDPIKAWILKGILPNTM